MRRITSGSSSADKRRHAVGAGVADPDAVVGQERGGQPADREEGERERLVAGRELAATHSTLEADVDVVPDIAVRIANDLALRFGIDADEPADRHREAGLL